MRLSLEDSFWKNVLEGSEGDRILRICVDSKKYPDFVLLRTNFEIWIIGSTNQTTHIIFDMSMHE